MASTWSVISDEPTPGNTRTVVIREIDATLNVNEDFSLTLPAVANNNAFLAQFATLARTRRDVREAGFTALDLSAFEGTV